MLTVYKLIARYWFANAHDYYERDEVHNKDFFNMTTLTYNITEQIGVVERRGRRDTFCSACGRC